MAKGFIRGVLWGGGVSLITLAAVSIFDTLIESSDLRGAASEAARAAPGVNRDKSRDTLSAAGLATTEVPAPEPDTLASLVAEALEPAALPQTGNASGLDNAAAPDADALSGIAGPDNKAPNVHVTGTEALTTPATEPGVSVSTDPAQPLAPDPVPQATAFADAQPVGSEAEVPAAPAPTVTQEIADEPLPEEDRPPEALAEMSESLMAPQGADTSSSATLVGDGEPDPPVRSSQQIVAAAPGAVTAPTAETDRIFPAQDAPETSGAPEQPVSVSSVDSARLSLPTDLALDPARAPADVAPMPAPGTADAQAKQDDSSATQVDAGISIVSQVPAPLITAADTPRASPIATAPDVRPNSVLPNVARTEVALAPAALEPAAPRAVATQPTAPVRSASEVRVNRLPSLQEDPADPEAEAPDQAAAVETPEEEAAPGPPGTPVARFAAPFDAPEGVPLMAVVLLDEGGDLSDAVTGIAALQDLPYPISVAVDPLAYDAPDRMAAFRAGGFEVLAVIDLPEGATATDAEVNVSAALDTLPEIIGVMEGTGSGIQSSPAAGRQVADILAETGHGFVSQNRGLNTTQKLAARQGVPSNVVFRDFDAAQPDEAVIRRFMDQAAFRAARDGDVVMMGRLRPGTLAALLSWSLQDRASTVAMAPVSAVLQQETGS